MSLQNTEEKTAQHLVAFQDDTTFSLYERDTADNERSLKPHAWIKSDYTMEIKQ